MKGRVGVKWKTGISGRTKKRLWSPIENIPKIYIGLGNPGQSYAGIRHNIGSDWVNYFVNKMELNWEDYNNELNCNIAFFDDGNILFIQPNRYLNMYGPTLAKILNELNRPIQDCVIIHDCLYTKFGTWRHQKGGFHGYDMIL